MKLYAFITYGKNCRESKDCDDLTAFWGLIDLEEFETQRYKYEDGLIKVQSLQRNYEEAEIIEMSTNKILSLQYFIGDNIKILNCLNTYRYCFDKNTLKKVKCLERPLTLTDINRANRSKKKFVNKKKSKYET